MSALPEPRTAGTSAARPADDRPDPDRPETGEQSPANVQETEQAAEPGTAPEPAPEAGPAAGGEPAADPLPGSTPPPQALDSRRLLGLMLLLTVLGAVLVLWAVSCTWTRGSTAGFEAARLQLSATGAQISGLPGALAVVGLASTVAVFAVRGTGRILLGALVALAGLGVAIGALLGRSDTAALNAAAIDRLALTSAQATRISQTPWPWVAFVGGLLLCAAGLLTALQGRDWPTMGNRYDAPARKVPARRAGAETPVDLWSAQDRGEDPSEDPPAVPGAAPQA